MDANGGRFLLTCCRRIYFSLGFFFLFVNLFFFLPLNPSLLPPPWLAAQDVVVKGGG